MKDVLIGIDAGTSVIKSVAFDLDGKQIGIASKPNRYDIKSNGAATQNMAQTWADCAETLRALSEEVPNLRSRVAALAVTAQGDGTWLIDQSGNPLGEGWIWLDSRAADLTEAIRGSASDRLRYEITGTGLNACQQSTHLLWMAQNTPEILEKAAHALHPKDWLYYNLTGVVATDPSEGSFTFGSYKTRNYSIEVIESLGLKAHAYLLPEMVDGSKTLHRLTAKAAQETGLPEGLPVALGFVDVVCTAMGAGIFDPTVKPGCTIIGSTGMHMRLSHSDDVKLNDDATGYVMVLPAEGYVAQIQSNMASTLNLDWVLDLGAELISEFGEKRSRKDLLAHMDHWLDHTKPGQVLYQPYISDAGERGPFVNSKARAGFMGLRLGHRYPDLVRGVVEGLGLAARDCYDAMGALPEEVRLTGGAARSLRLRKIMAACLGANIRSSSREEAGAAGAVMMASVAIGADPSMEECAKRWADPLLSECEAYDQELAEIYRDIFPAYQTARHGLTAVWAQLSSGKDQQ